MARVAPEDYGRAAAVVGVGILQAENYLAGSMLRMAAICQPV